MKLFFTRRKGYPFYNTVPAEHADIRLDVPDDMVSIAKMLIADRDAAKVAYEAAVNAIGNFIQTCEAQDDPCSSCPKFQQVSCDECHGM